MDVDGHGLQNRASPSRFLDEMWDKKKKIMYSDDTLMFRKKRIRFLLQILLVFQVIICCIQPVCSMVKENIVITEADFQALQAFKNQLIDPKGFLKSWNDSGLGACGGGWEGIKCAGGQVIVIQLPWRGLGGRLTDKIGQLQALRKLSLHDNAIGGTIPSTLGYLPNLRGVHLFNNRFSGSIPYALGLCPLLQTLDFSNNSLSGTIPSILFNSTKLLKLNFSYNSLSGSIPPSIGESSSLLFVAFQHNNLSGTIPSFLGGNEKAKAKADLIQLQSLRLDYNSFSGTIPPSLGSLSGLQELSFSHNSLSGFIPEDLGSLSNLKTLDLSFNDLNGSFPNQFSNLSALINLNLENNQLNGQLPESLDKLQNLSVLSLNNNYFTGPIPETIANVSTLTQLDLSLNNFTGEIAPSFDDLSKLSFLNVSYNSLSGPVPSGLSQKFNASSFLGNLQLCGYNGSIQCPLSPPPRSPPAPSPEEAPKKRHKLSVKDIILIVAGILLVILLLLCIILACILFPKRKKKSSENQAARTRAIATGVGEKGTPPSASEIEKSAGEIGGKLVHFDGPTVFATDDLLCATAEIMGKSTYGTVYKATLEDGSVVAVKRLREKITKGQNEFETEVNLLGKIRHPNLLALRAYYLGPKGEKLLVFDYMSKGSLATFLHARGPDTPFDWPTRMRIVQGMARGLLYLHTEANVIHGNLTSSIVLLDEQTNPKISDYGLSCLMTPAANANVIATAGSLGYRAPEVSNIKKTNTKTDVYSFGVIILELLTGKSPGEAMDGLDLPQWVASIVKEEWTNEVFDLELMKDAPAIGDELLNTLKLALHCVDPSPSARPEVQDILQQLEEIRRSEVVVATSSEDVTPTTAADAAQLPE